MPTVAQTNTAGYSANWPESVKVRFRTKICPHPICDAPKPPPKYYVKEVKIEDVASTQFVGYPGYYVVHDSAIATYDGTSDDPTNQEEIDDLAKQIATDFYNWRSFRFDYVYNGVIVPPTNALVDTAEIVITANDAKTRITSAPFNGEPEELSHYADACDYETPVVYVPTASRHGNYLRLPKAKLIKDDTLNELYLCTSSHDDIFVCCGSSSSSSSSSSTSEPTCEQIKHDLCPPPDGLGFLTGFPICVDCECLTPLYFNVSFCEGGHGDGPCPFPQGPGHAQTVDGQPCVWAGIVGALACHITVDGNIITVTFSCSGAIPPYSWSYEGIMPYNNCCCKMTLGQTGTPPPVDVPSCINLEPSYF